MSFGNANAEFGQAATQWQKMIVDSWGQWTKAAVGSDATPQSISSGSCPGSFITGRLPTRAARSSSLRPCSSMPAT